MITLNTLLLNLWLNNDIKILNPINQQKDADVTPSIKCIPASLERVALNAPSITVPSIIACGLNHVTTQADVIAFSKGMSILSFFLIHFYFLKVPVLYRL